MKTDNSPMPARHGGWNRLLVLIFSLALLCIGYLSVVQNTFASASSLQNFLRDAKAFNYTADIIQSEISDKLPQKIKDNVIEQALIAKFMDFVITPENVERLANPSIQIIYKTANTPTSIINNKVVIDTTTYKAQASSYIASLKLPDAITQPGLDLVGSVPTQLTLVDITKHPNSPLALLIRVRGGLRTIRTVLTVSWWVAAAALFLVLVLNLHNIKRLCKSLAWGFGVPAVVIVVGSWVFPVLIAVLGPKSTDPVIGESTNGLVNSLVTNAFAATRNFGFICLVIAIIAGLVYTFVPLHKPQAQLDAAYDKLAKRRLRHAKKPTRH